MTRETTTVAATRYTDGRDLLPGGYGRALMATVGPGSPIAARAEGYRVWDTDGHELLDFNGNFTTLVHGNAHPAITAAAVDAARAGASFGLPNGSELSTARALMARMPRLDLIRFTNSGTEASMAALRVARAHTGRNRVILVRAAYHGWSDATVSTNERARRGVATSATHDSVIVPINDEAALEQALAADEIAAVMIDCMPNRVGMLQLTPEFAAAAQRLARRYGAALVIDEVINFRHAIGGMHSLYDLDPDLVVLGKMIGGGFAVGAVAGKREWMSELDAVASPGVEHGGTFSGNPVTMEAGRVTLELLDERAIQHIRSLGDTLRDRLAVPLERSGWEARGFGSLLRFFPQSQLYAADEHRALWWATYERGVLISQHGVAAVSTVMDEEVIDWAASAIGEAVGTVASAEGV